MWGWGVTFGMALLAICGVWHAATLFRSRQKWGMTKGSTITLLSLMLLYLSAFYSNPHTAYQSFKSVTHACYLYNKWNHVVIRGMISGIEDKMPFPFYLFIPKEWRNMEILSFDVKTTKTFLGNPISARKIYVDYQPYGINRQKLFVGNELVIYARYDGDRLTTTGCDISYASNQDPDLERQLVGHAPTPALPSLPGSLKDYAMERETVHDVERAYAAWNQLLKIRADDAAALDGLKRIKHMKINDIKDKLLIDAL